MSKTKSVASAYGWQDAHATTSALRGCVAQTAAPTAEAKVTSASLRPTSAIRSAEAVAAKTATAQPLCKPSVASR